MAYEKRVCVLKQVKKGFSADGGELGGAVYCERLGDTLTVTPRVLGLAPVREGRYLIALQIGEKTFCLELGGGALCVEKAPSLKDGFAVLILFARGEAEPVAFGSCGQAAKSCERLLFEVSGSVRRLPTPLPPNEIPLPALPNVPKAPGVPVPGSEPEEPKEAAEKSAAPPFRGAKYDDEAIAASDYFRPARRDEDEGPSCGEEENAASEAGGGAAEAHAAPLFPRGSLTYYNSVREKLEAAMKKYPPDTRLKGAFPCSEWVLAEGGALLGVVYEAGSPRYLCVAVEKTEGAPEEMKDRWAFVPASPFSEEEGFYVVFQDADTGEYVTVSDS